MFSRFRPYFSYLRPQRGLLAVAIVCGIVAGLASGAALTCEPGPRQAARGTKSTANQSIQLVLRIDGS